MALTDYTTYDQIRAVFSVTDAELEDTTLAQPLYETQLMEQFRLVGEDVEQKFLDLQGVMVSNMTYKEKRFYRLVGVFSTYAVCMELLQSLELLAVKSEQDARAQYERFGPHFDRIAESVKAGFLTAQARLTEAYNDIATVQITAATRTFRVTGAVGLAVDPVTNT